MKDFDAIVAILAVILMASGLGAWTRDISLKKEAVKTECAQYNQTTGDFEWIINDSKSTKEN